MGLLIALVEWLSIELRHVWRDGSKSYAWKLYGTVKSRKTIPLSILNLKIIISLKPVGIRFVVNSSQHTDTLGYAITHYDYTTRLASQLTVTLATL